MELEDCSESKRSCNYEELKFSDKNERLRKINPGSEETTSTAVGEIGEPERECETEGSSQGQSLLLRTAGETKRGSTKLEASITLDSNGNPPRQNKRTGKQRCESTGSYGICIDDEVASALERTPPDGGWGWVVVVASFMVNCIADGVTFSFGIFYKEFLDYFKQSKSATAWIGSLLAAMPLLSGPVASMLTDRYGCRKVTVLGSLLSTLGFILSYYATSIEMLILTFGVITGFGLSLCYVAAVVIVAYYFEKKRSLATGLSVCGGGIGTSLFSPLTSRLIDRFGWRMTTLILSGAFFFLSFCGVLMKDLEWKKKKPAKGNLPKSNKEKFFKSVSTIPCDESNEILKNDNVPGNQFDRLCSSAICIPTFLQEQEHKIPNDSIAGNSVPKRHRNYYGYYRNPYPANITHYAVESLKKKGNSVAEPLSSSCLPYADDDEEATELTLLTGNNTNDPPKSTHGFPEPLHLKPNGNIAIRIEDCSTTDENSVIPNDDEQKTSNQAELENGNVSTLQENEIQFDFGQINNETRHNDVDNSNPNGNVISPSQAQRKLDMKNFVVLNTSCDRSMLHRQSLTYRGAVFNLKRYKLRPASSCPDIMSIVPSQSDSQEGIFGVCTEMVSWFQNVCDWDYLQNIGYILFLLSNLLLYTWYDVPYMYLQDAALNHGYSEDLSSYLISIVGIFNMVGNVFLGYMGDKKWMNSLFIYGICMAFCGAATAMMPYLMTCNYATLSISCAVFGLTIAANYSLTSVILVKVVTLERFASAYGLLLLVQGIGNLVGPPLAGVIYDWTTTSSWSFVVAGGGIFSSSLFMLNPNLFHSSDGRTNPPLESSGNNNVTNNNNVDDSHIVA